MQTGEYYIRALEKVKAYGESAKSRAEDKQEMLYRDMPLLKEYDDEIRRLCMDAVKLSMSPEQDKVNELLQKNKEMQTKRLELLKSAGLCEDDLLPDFKCKKCSDTGYVNGKMCSCVRTLASKMIYDEINRDVPLDECRFDTFDLSFYPKTPDADGMIPFDTMEKIKAKCIEYADNFTNDSPSMLFFGRTGLGKTHLSLSIVNEVIKKGYNVVYAPISRVLQQIENEHFSNDSNSDLTLQSVLACDLLIIDDLGTEFTTTFVTSTIYDIINTRCLAKKPIILNTNLDFSELENKYSERVVSRISGTYKLFKFTGEDVRTLK